MDLFFLCLVLNFSWRCITDTPLRTKSSTLHVGRCWILRQIFRLHKWNGKHGIRNTIKHLDYNCVFLLFAWIQVTEEFCDDGLVFDVIKDKCELPHAVQCGDRKKQRNLFRQLYLLYLKSLLKNDKDLMDQ